MNGRPEFIPREIFRSYLSVGALNKYCSISGILVSSFISRCDRERRPLRCKMYQGSRRYRLLDVVARAAADGLTILAPEEILLIHDIATLRAKKAQLDVDVKASSHRVALHHASKRLTGSTLLTPEEIAAGRMDIPAGSGVYFLLKGQCIVYVGQATQVFRRVGEHIGSKDFDGFAFVQIAPHALNVLESLYIHALRPQLNVRWSGAVGVNAPLRLDELLERQCSPTS